MSTAAKRRSTIASLVATLLLVVGSDLAAQELRVRVSEPGRPDVAIGVLVTLLRPDGSVAASAVTNDFGRVRLPSPPGPYQVRIERPGFVDTTVAVTVPAGLDSLTIRHGAARPAFPTKLQTLPATCSAGGIPEALDPLWRVAARTLRVVAATEATSATTESIAAFERALSPSLRRESEQLNTILAPANRPANRRPPDLAAQLGYFNRDTLTSWAAPDVEVFLSAQFGTGHCFGMVTGTEGREGLLGLRFAPVAGELVEIEGTFWLDPIGRDLKVIDYRFTGVPTEWRPDRFGGSLEFHRSEQGFWVTRFWYQRVPALEAQGGKPKLKGYREDGAEVTAITPTIDTTDRIATARAIAKQNQAIRMQAASMAGQVIDTLGYPVPDADVVVMGTGHQASTNREGRFTMTGLPLGLQIVQARKLGFKAQYFGIRLAGGQEWEGKISLRQLPQILGEIMVVGKYGKPAQYARTSKYDDFYRRRAAKNGKFLTREDIDKSAAGRISELLRSIPGVRVGFTAPGESEDVSFLTCEADQVSVWIDGQKLSGNVGEILPLIAPGDVETLEVYQRQSQIPPEFRDNSCAAIVMWTR